MEKEWIWETARNIKMRTVTSIPRMYADASGLKHGDLTEKLIGIFFSIHNELGHGFRRYVFENAKKHQRNPRESVEKKLPRSSG